MAFEGFRARMSVDPRFTDDDIRDAVRAVRKRGLEPLDKYVKAQLNLALFAKTLRKPPE